MSKRLEPVLVAASSLLLMVGGGWVGDVLKGDCLSLGDLLTCAPRQLDWRGLLVSLAVFAGGALGLFYLTRNYLPVRHLRARRNMPGRKAVIAAVSTFTKGTEVAADGSEVRAGDGRIVRLEGDIDADIQALDLFFNNVQQFLRALRPHVKAGLTRAVLLGSPATINARGQIVPGSASALPRYEAMLRRYAPNVVVTMAEIDFEEVEGMLTKIVQQVRLLTENGDVMEEDIIIDVTGGQKSASIAAALATLHSRGLECQYVSANQPHDVLTFDMVAENPVRLGS